VAIVDQLVNFARTEGQPMSALRIKLNATFADRRVREFEFEQARMFIVGTAHDCDIRVPAEDGHAVSCYHCVLAIDPPRIRVRDLFSRNGTFVNGERIGQGPESIDSTAASGIELKPGDVLRVGGTVFQVLVEVAGRSASPSARRGGNRGFEMLPPLHAAGPNR
jgi:pSer/pThr/pTyr-binding forkhead associated (FHA) protein